MGWKGIDGIDTYIGLGLVCSVIVFKFMTEFYSFIVSKADEIALNIKKVFF